MDREEVHRQRARVVEMFWFGFNGYLQHAFPLDELCPISCRGRDTWGSYRCACLRRVLCEVTSECRCLHGAHSLTLIDALDTLAVMGEREQFFKWVRWFEANWTSFDIDKNVSVFETNIRVLGGL